MAEMPRRGIGRIPLQPRKVPNPVSVLEPLARAANAVERGALNAFGAAYKAYEDYAAKTDELAFQAKLDNMETNVVATLKEQEMKLLEAGETTQARALYSQYSTDLANKAAEDFGPGLYGVRAKTRLLDTVSNMKLANLDRVIARNHQIGVASSDNAYDRIVNEAGTRGMILDNNIRGRAIVDTQNGLFSKEENEARADRVWMRASEEAMRYHLETAKQIFDSHGVDGYNDAIGYLKNVGPVVENAHPQAKQLLISRFQDMRQGLEQAQMVRDQKAEKATVKSMLDDIKVDTKSLNEAAAAGADEQYQAKKAKFIDMANDPTLPPDVRRAAQLAIPDQATEQKFQQSVAPFNRAEEVRQGKRVATGPSDAKALDYKLGQDIIALGPNASANERMATVNQYIVNSGQVTEHAQSEYQILLDDATTVDGAEKLADSWAELQELGGSGKFSKNSKTGRDIQVFLTEYRAAKSALPTGKSIDPVALQGAVSQARNKVNEQVTPDVVKARRDTADNKDSLKTMNVVYENKVLPALETRLKGFSQDAQRNGSYASAESVKQEIFQFARDIYVSNLGGDAATNLPKAMQIATDEVLSHWAFTGRGWQKNSAFKFSANGQPNPTQIADIKAQMLAGGYTDKDTPEAFYNSIQWVGKDDSDEPVAFYHTNTGAIKTVTDINGRPFKYKPGGK